MPNQTYNADLEKLHSLLDQEDTNATLEYLSDITKTRRNEWRVWAIAAKAYQKLEFWEHSEDAYSKVISMVGGGAEFHLQLGLVQRCRGKISDSVQTFKAAISIDPILALAHLNLGNSLRDLGQLDEAIDAYQAALAIDDGQAIFHNNLGNALIDKKSWEGARRCYEKAITCDHLFAPAYNNLGNLFRRLGDFHLALVAYQSSVAADFTLMEAHLNAGVTSQDLGNFELATHHYQKAVGLAPSSAIAVRHLCALDSFRPSAEFLKEVEKNASNSEINSNDRSQYCFAAYDCFKKNLNVDKAVNYLRHGNKLRREELGYDLKQDTSINQLLRGEAPIWADNPISMESVAELKEKPIFVVCMPRSGSTLVERILSAHSDVCGLGELNTAGVITSELLREDKSPERKVQLLREYYLDSVVIPDAGARYFVDKTPENFRLLLMLGAAFPEARVIHVYRDAAATCWSNYEHYFTSLGLGFSYDLNDLVRYYNDYICLMREFSPALGERIYHLSYERLTDNQAQEIAGLFNFLDLEMEPEVIDHNQIEGPVVTASNQQVRMPTFRGSSDRWKTFEHFVGEAFSELLQWDC